MATDAIGWTEGVLQTIERLQPEYVFTDYAEVPQQYDNLPQISCQWVVYTIDDADLALRWLHRGATLVETNNFGALIKNPTFNIVC